MQDDTPETEDPLHVEAIETLQSHPITILVLLPFILVFLWAAWLEFRRWWRYGHSENNRARFPIDEDAPSYEPPDTDTETETEQPGKPGKH